jgi:hypothetical protein
MNNSLIAPVVGRRDWYRVEDDTVVTRDKAGNAVSRFGDDVWDIRAYTIGPRIHIYFRGHLPVGVSWALLEATTRQWKQVMYFLMHEVTDTVPASATLQHSSTCLKGFTFFAAERQLTLYEGLSNVAVVLDYAVQAGMETKAQILHSILVKLHRLGVASTGLRVPLAQLHKPLLERFAQRAGNSQYPVIPTRIYQHFLSTCEHDLRVAEGVADMLSAHLARVYAGERPGISADLIRTALHFGGKESPYIVSFLVASIGAMPAGHPVVHWHACDGSGEPAVRLPERDPAGWRDALHHRGRHDQTVGRSSQARMLGHQPACCTRRQARATPVGRGAPGARRARLRRIDGRFSPAVLSYESAHWGVRGEPGGEYRT